MMTSKQLILIGMALLLMVAFAGAVSAQRGGDSDGDGLPDSADSCPRAAGPRDNGGCPVNVPDGAGTPDRDSDGVPDYIDGCPDAVGTGYTNGCPPDDSASDDPTAEQSSSPPLVTFTWGSFVRCVVGLPPPAAGNVNIRERATINSPIIGQLAPGDQFEPYFRDYDENNTVWFGGAPVGGGAWGWVAGSVVGTNGQCANLPMIIHVDAPFQFDIHLTLDPDLLPDAVPYWKVTLQEALVTGYQHSGSDGTSAADGGVEHTDNWDVQAVFVKFTMFREDGTPLSDDQHFEPLLLVKNIDPNAPEHNCAAIGEGFCLIAGLLLPAFGDEPGQCPPPTFVEGLQAAFPGDAAFGDGDVDGRDFLIWQRHLGSHTASAFGLLLPANDDPAAGEFYDGWINIESFSSSTTTIGLLLPAIQAAYEAAAQSSEPKPGLEFSLAGDGSVLPVEQISFVYEKIDWGWHRSCTIIGVVPGGDTAVMGDGSVRFLSDSVAVLLPVV
jgi:hypothetical protein